MQTLHSIITWYNEYIGSYAIMILLVPAGLYFTFRFGFIQVRGIIHAIKITAGKYDNPNEKGDVSHFKALCTALSATVGTGNIAGVALAIYFGGPGAIFWMWVTGFLGMATKFTSCTLALKYRKINADGSVSGGPMYYIKEGLKHRLGKFATVLAFLFAFGTIICSIGTGNMAQSNSMADALFTNYAIPHWLSGLVVAFFVFMVIVGGIKKIASVTSYLVPIMAAFYIMAALTVIFLNIDNTFDAFALIFRSAFSGHAAAGGFIGSTIMMTARAGIARGLFSNEAGQGSAPIAHAAAKTQFPVREGLVALLEPLIDTLLICTMTALVIIFTNTWDSGLKGVSMTISAYSTGLDKIGMGYMGEHIVAIGLFLFAFSTAISWSYYGDRAAEFIFGPQAIKPYRIIYCVFIFLGAIFTIDFIWAFVDMAITFMTIPNIIAILLLSGVVAKETKKYFKEKEYLIK
ncbi:MAG: sodium:alanine symporter family protein [Pseudomonadota bacterium]